ncbi:cytochrome ubiquinol oxidase subunit I [Actinomadura sp. DC4]|uniref:cytochrome ubiquinol oxidase subunit I n=1 Tax=Actinomadura sp. DC4 TaxID=3055069 RepID=UPI0025B20ACD|nr:cytochrome ubiquinol oxidase subunit I [Actinomadura sp. DC4]MDN3354611.1 cytochrome ubiquinol oxidase subunit I [Actinomadura sp. DC4]
MSTLSLARLLFAVTAGTHFLFVALTLGLATLVAITQTRAVAKDSDVLRGMVRFWGQLYVINYAVGIVTGLLMEFQFGLNWPGLTDRARDVFGAPLAMETLVAFFVESTFLGLWIFGWDRLNRHAHLALIWIVTLTGYVSAYFILVANGFLTNPVGYVQAGGELRIDSATKLFTNPAALLPLGHIVSGALLVGGFFMAGISAWHMRRTGPDEFFRRSLRTGLVAVVVAILPSILFGVPQFDYTHDRLTAAGEVGAYLMMFAWLAMFLISLVALLKLLIPRWMVRGRLFQAVLVRVIGVPYVAMLGGWFYRENSRQPWLIYGVLRTEDAVRPMSRAAMASVTAGVTALFLVLVVVNIGLLRGYARRGPEGAALGRAEAAELPEPVPSF